MKHFSRTRMISTNAEIVKRGTFYDVIYDDRIVGFNLKKELAFDLALNPKKLEKLNNLRKNS